MVNLCIAIHQIFMLTGLLNFTASFSQSTWELGSLSMLFKTEITYKLQINKLNKKETKRTKFIDNPETKHYGRFPYFTLEQVRIAQIRNTGSVKDIATHS